MTSSVLQGDAKTVLQGLADECVDMIVTSPPYYGLRNYNVEGQIGMEETPEQYVQRLVEVFGEGKRVLRNTGVFWLNIGDSYAGSGRGPTGHNGIGNQTERQGFDKQDTNRGLLKYNPLGGVIPSSCKPKDLIGIPWMLAFALRADGWYLRSDIPWVKRNSMPSSVTDRPASSIEHIFLFAKSRTYYYDHIATMQPSSESYNKDKRPRGKIRQTVNANSKYPDEGQYARSKAIEEKLEEASSLTGVPVSVVARLTGTVLKKQDHTGNETYTGFNARYEDSGNGLRFMRDSDFFFRTWQGLLHNENGEPMSMVVNPRGYKGAHFACFPVQLVEPMILAGTSEKGVCPECGAPWVRVVEKGQFRNQSWGGEHTKMQDAIGGVGATSCLKSGGTCDVNTVGWKPSCSCSNNIPVPATVLDPFSGSGATGVACQWHDRDYVGIELNLDYCTLQHQRLKENR